MSELGDEDNPVGLAWGRGIPEQVAKTIVPARFNRIDVLRRIFERDGEDIAAVIVEPILGNAQAILPRDGFHQEMRELTREFGALLIFDEVKTGFRIAKGGAAEYFGVTPDLATYAKAIGNGYPAAVFAGTDEVMSVLPDKVSHGGTYAGNRVAAAAAVGDAQDPARHGCARVDPPGRPIGPGGPRRGDLRARPAVRLHRPPGDVRDHVHGAGADRVPRLGRTRTTTCTTPWPSGMHARGAMPEPDSREPWFFCEAHAREDIVDRVVTIFADSLDAALEARAKGDMHGVEASQWSMAGTPASAATPTRLAALAGAPSPSGRLRPMPDFDDAAMVDARRGRPADTRSRSSSSSSSRSS